MKDIIHTVSINAVPGEVFKQLTTTEGLAGWWTTNVSMPKDDEVQFYFMEEFQPRMKVTRQKAGEVVAWKCLGGNPLWENAVIRFELSAGEGGTQLLFHHQYAQELDKAMFGNFNFNWAYYLQSLKMLCEEGQGKPLDPSRQPAG
jgi:hypothetical protein